MLKLSASAFAVLGLLAPAAVMAQEADLYMTTPEGPGEEIGEIEFDQGDNALVIDIEVEDLSPGTHGLHIHENGSCDPATQDGEVVPAGAAGGHWDPEGTGSHEGPTGKGHLGDLPVLVVDDDGEAELKLYAPRITDASQLVGLAVMIHEGGDNYRDEPEKLGGGGPRVACGVIE